MAQKYWEYFQEVKINVLTNIHSTIYNSQNMEVI
jgi:hypothetical protein